jgi:hypothetical protein
MCEITKNSDLIEYGVNEYEKPPVKRGRPKKEEVEEPKEE